MNVGPLQGPLPCHDHLLSLVLSIGKRPIEIAIVLKLQVARIQFRDQHSTRGDRDLGEWKRGDVTERRNVKLTTRASVLFSRAGMSPVVKRYVPKKRSKNPLNNLTHFEVLMVAL